jgi:hypothetical protein
MRRDRRHRVGPPTCRPRVSHLWAGHRHNPRNVDCRLASVNDFTFFHQLAAGSSTTRPPQSTHDDDLRDVLYVPDRFGKILRLNTDTSRTPRPLRGRPTHRPSGTENRRSRARHAVDEQSHVPACSQDERRLDLSFPPPGARSYPPLVVSEATPRHHVQHKVLPSDPAHFGTTKRAPFESCTAYRR